VAVIAGFLVVVLGSFIWLREISILQLFSAFNLSGLRFYEAITVSPAVVALAVFIRTRSRMAAIITMGVVGYAVAIIFILFGAPDVAITQFLIETLTVVLFVLVLHKLPPLKFYSVKYLKYIYAAISVAFGLMMATILLLVTSHPLVSGLKEYYAENTYLLGQGRNAVNVILVDFRALDTMGEISVLAIAAVGIVALLKLKIVKGSK
jgi:multicomponent Na+:H+ antiporter subunit A